MTDGNRERFFFGQAPEYAALCLILLGSLACASARAEDSAQSGGSSLGVASGPNPEQGLPIGGWIVYPSFYSGAVFNDNVYNSATNKQGAVGIDLRPSFIATLDNGIYKTQSYFGLDAQIYPGSNGAGGSLAAVYGANGGTTSASNVQGRAGFSQIYQPLPDLTFTAAFDFSRLLGLFGTGFGVGGQAPSLYVPNGVVASGLPLISNQFTGSLSVQKEITDRAFVAWQGGVQGVIFDSRPSSGIVSVFSPESTQQNGVNLTTSVRLGYWVGPMVYAYVEPGGSFRRYQNSLSDTNGYRVVGGLGSDQIGLFKGEIYGGYQSQSSANGQAGVGANSPAFGGRLYYYPTPYLTVSASADESLGSTTPSSVSNGLVSSPLVNPLLAIAVSPATSSRAFQSMLQADYAFSQYWSAHVRGGYGETLYTNSSRVDSTWMAGVGGSYTFWRNLAFTVDYQFSRIDSSNANIWSPFSGSRYSQNIVTAGVTYNY